MRLNSRLSFPLAIILLFLQADVQAETATPTTVVKAAMDEIISVLRNDTLTTDGKWQQISQSIKDNFDFRSMSQDLLATHWDSASPKEKKLCAEYFAQYLESVYRDRIESYTNQSIVYVDEVVTGDDAIVNTLIVAESAEIPVSYKMRMNEGQWTVYDMLIDEISLMDSHRFVLYSIIQSEGMGGLLIDLQRKISKYKMTR